MAFIKRDITAYILSNLGAFPAVYLNGPRQAGKTTLVRELIAQNFPAKFITFDDVLERASALRSPESYLRNLGYPLAIDEVQMVPDLFYPLKMLIDEQRFENLEKGLEKPNGHYILTGSANLLALPNLAQAMVGRMGTVTLFPLRAGEYWGKSSQFMHWVFADKLTDFQVSKYSILDAMEIATYPELIGLAEQARKIWFQNYIQKITVEDPKHLYSLEKAEYMPVLLQSLATRAGGLINDADISRDTGLTAVTNRTYRGLLEGSFVVMELPSWHRNINKRLVKSGKIYFYDTLLLTQLLGSTPLQLAKQQPKLFGHVLENFVLTELIKHKSSYGHDLSIHFYRTHEAKEVDFILESGGKLVGIEVKHSEKITEKDLQGLKEFRAVAGKDFLRGIILCQCKRIMDYGDGIYLVPISALWETGSQR